jgi:hypothetical protein
MYETELSSTYNEAPNAAKNYRDRYYSYKAQMAMKPAAAEPPRDKLAHVQIALDEKSLCSNLITLANLWSGPKGSVAVERVLLYPKSWEDKTSSSARFTTRRLLGVAQQRYSIKLIPLSSLDTEVSASGASTDGQLDLDVEGYLQGLSGGYVRALYLPPSLSISVPRTFDQLLSTRISKPFSYAFSGSQTSSVEKLHLISSVYDESTYVSPSALIAPRGERASYLLLPKEKGPWYDVPIPTKDVASGMKLDGKERDAVRSEWEQYRMKREDICGLDLIPWNDDKAL